MLHKRQIIIPYMYTILQVSYLETQQNVYCMTFDAAWCTQASRASSPVSLSGILATAKINLWVTTSHYTVLMKSD